jgi:hypothetical protein
MGGGQIFLKTSSASLFNEDPSKEPNFGQIHLAGQYLSIKRQLPTTAAETFWSFSFVLFYFYS